MYEGWQRAGYRWIERQEGSEPCYQGGYEGRDADSHIVVAALGRQVHTQTETQDGGKRTEEERWPVATELDAESAAGKTTTDGNLPWRETALGGANLIQRLLVLLQ